MSSSLADNVQAIDVMFDTNSWRRVADPDECETDRDKDDCINIRRALQAGQLRGYFSETSVLLEQVRRTERSTYPARSLSDAISIVESPTSEVGHFGFQLVFGGTTDAHNGICPRLHNLLAAAFALGLTYTPTSRIGTVRPPDWDRYKDHIIPNAADEEDVWDLLQRVSDACEVVEHGGFGMAQVREIAEKLRRRHQIMDSGVWSAGLDRIVSKAERKELANAWAEWADGDTVALAAGYRIPFICTNDQAGGRRDGSIFSMTGRRLIDDAFDIKVLSRSELVDFIRSGCP